MPSTQTIPPQDVSKPQAQSHAEQEQDCLGCRVTGLMMGLGGCGYLSSRLLVEPYPVGGHKYAILAASGACLLLGLGRAAGFR